MTTLITYLHDKYPLFKHCKLPNKGKKPQKKKSTTSWNIISHYNKQKRENNKCIALSSFLTKVLIY